MNMIAHFGPRMQEMPSFTTYFSKFPGGAYPRTPLPWLRATRSRRAPMALSTSVSYHKKYLVFVSKYFPKYLYLYPNTFSKCVKYLYLYPNTFEKYLVFANTFQILFRVLFENHVRLFLQS